MQNWQIDCATFLQLTGAELGDNDMYWIEESGVRGNLDTSMDAMRLLESHEQAFRLSLNRNMRIDFPVAAGRLIEWVQAQAGDFQLPDWFVSAAQSDTQAEARAELEQARVELEARLASGPLTKDESRSTSYFRLSRADAVAEFDAVEHLLGICGVSAVSTTGAAHPTSKYERNDAMARELNQALVELPGKPTPEEVMQQLRTYAGKAGSCITEVAQDGVIWRRDNGTRSKMTLKNLRDRMGRLGKLATLGTESTSAR